MKRALCETKVDSKGSASEFTYRLIENQLPTSESRNVRIRLGDTLKFGDIPMTQVCLGVDALENPYRLASRRER